MLQMILFECPKHQTLVGSSISWEIGSIGCKWSCSNRHDIFGLLGLPIYFPLSCIYFCNIIGFTWFTHFPHFFATFLGAIEASIPSENQVYLVYLFTSLPSYILWVIEAYTPPEYQVYLVYPFTSHPKYQVYLVYPSTSHPCHIFWASTPPEPVQNWLFIIIYPIYHLFTLFFHWNEILKKRKIVQGWLNMEWGT